MKHPSIRRADRQDAALLSELGARTFYEAFANANSSANMEAYVAEAFSLEQIETALRDQQSYFWIASDSGGTAIGYLKLREGSCPCSLRGPSPVEIQRIYVSQTSIGTGAGARLMGTALAWAKRNDFGSIWLGVWNQNRRAIEFYERWGFKTVGEVAFQLGSESQTDLIMEYVL